LDGKLFCATFDFGFDLLTQILMRAPSATASFVSQSLAEDSRSIRRLTLPIPVNVGVAAALGNLQQGMYEAFIPLVIQSVFGDDPTRMLETLDEQRRNENDKFWEPVAPGLGEKSERLERDTETEQYKLNTRDKALLTAARVLLEKVVAARSTKHGQSKSAAKLLRILSNLPEFPSEKYVSVSVIRRSRRYGDITTSRWWEVLVEGRRIAISSGGYFYRPPSGGDSFTAMEWSATPHEAAQFNDYRDVNEIVPDLRSFPEEVATVDLGSEGYSLEIYDEDNPLLEENERKNDDDGDDDDDESPASFEDVDEARRETVSSKIPWWVTAAGFVSPQEWKESGAPFLSAGFLWDHHEAQQYTLRFDKAHNPEGEARAWAIRFQGDYRSFAAYKTPGGDVVVLYIHAGSGGILCS
jgi:hypothetical protein